MPEKTRINPDSSIPQILAVTRVTGDGRINLRKSVREYLDIEQGRPLYLDVKEEIALTAKKSGAAKPIVIDKNGVRLPALVLERLEIAKGALVGLVERDSAAAIKAYEVEEAEGDEARWSDVETPVTLTRRIETNPMPDRFLEKLSERHRGLKMSYNIGSFLAGRQSLEALRTRQLLDRAESSDQQLKQRLIADRLQKQQKNGSWQSSVTITARNLRELAELDLGRENLSIRRGIEWLLARPQSIYSPGLWFVRDELVKEQAEIIKKRKAHKGKGPKERFNRARTSEVRLVKAGDPIITHPCGTRIMWTSALVLEVLLALGCEKEKRVQTAIRTLMTNPLWCDNNYQHGLSSWQGQEPPPPNKLAMVEKAAIRFYRYGGIGNPAAFTRSETVRYFRRVGHLPSADGERYLLKMPLGVGEGCKLIMTKALSQAKDRRLRQLMSIRFWEFAGLLNLTEERIAHLSGSDFTDRAVFFLQLFSRSDHPAARLALVRTLPWLVKSQNRDGSWGNGPFKDATTYAVIGALVSLSGTSFFVPPLQEIVE